MSLSATSAWGKENLDSDEELDGEYENINVDFNGDIRAWDDSNDMFRTPPRVTMQTVNINIHTPAVHIHESGHLSQASESNHDLNSLDEAAGPAEMTPFVLRTAENGKPMRGPGTVYTKKETGVSTANMDREIRIGWFRFGFRYEWEFRFGFRMPKMFRGNTEELRAI